MPTLVLKCSANGLVNGVLDLCRRVDQVEVLATCSLIDQNKLTTNRSLLYDRTGLAHNTRIALVYVDIGGNLLPQLLEYEGAAGEVESRKVRVGNGLADDFLCDTRNELNDTWWNTGLGEDLIHEVVGVDSHR